jgi:dTDP-4-amino-4,6-dideoxygalactose transaminase
MTTTATQVDVPFLDLRPSHRPIKHEVLQQVEALIDSGAFTNGPAVSEFEAAFADYVGTQFSVGLASGLDALRLGLLAAGLAEGDEVIVPANTFIATLEAVSQAGGVPRIVDMSESDWNIDVQLADAAVSERTKAIMPVHLYGQMADMRAVLDLADRRHLSVVEDACQAHGATRGGITAGCAGLLSAFSFYPGKNLGAFGDAGALATNDESILARVRALREHGQRAKYEHEWQGYTARLDTIQAIVLNAKLPSLDGWNGERRAIASYYLDALAGVGDLELPPVAPESSPVWHLFVVRTGDPIALATFLGERGIATGRHYPEPVHLTNAYAELGHELGDFPVAERHAATALSLPIFPGMSTEQAEAVVAGVRTFYDGV